MTVRRFPSLLQAALLSLAALALATPALAQGDATMPAKAVKAKKKKKSMAAPKTGGGSSETTAERTQRLKRECKGRPNAGACLGFAS